jgi:hypothetical protein
MAAQLGDRRRPAGRRHDPGDQPLVPRLALVGGDRDVGHVRVLGQRGLDLADLDPVAAHLDLAVGAAEELDRPVGAAPRQVAGLVHDRAAGTR